MCDCETHALTATIAIGQRASKYRLLVNSLPNQIVDNRIADWSIRRLVTLGHCAWSTRGLDNSRTIQFAVWSIRGQVNSPTLGLKRGLQDDWRNGQLSNR